MKEETSSERIWAALETRLRKIREDEWFQLGPRDEIGTLYKRVDNLLSLLHLEKDPVFWRVE